MTIQKGVGKDIKKVRLKLLGPGSSFGIKKSEVGLLEFPETTMHREIEISLYAALLSSLDNMEPNDLVKAMVEFNSKALILSQGVGIML